MGTGASMESAGTHCWEPPTLPLSGSYLKMSLGVFWLFMMWELVIKPLAIGDPLTLQPSSEARLRVLTFQFCPGSSVTSPSLKLH